MSQFPENITVFGKNTKKPHKCLKKSYVQESLWQYAWIEA